MAVIEDLSGLVSEKVAGLQRGADSDLVGGQMIGSLVDRC